MSPIIISDKDPYVLDYIKGYDKIPALTHKNSNFIEAVVRLDSNYAKESSLVPPDQGFKPDTHVNHAKGLYSGSSKYWFDAMVKGTEPFDTALLGAIIAIDRSNSTHLEASNGGRLEMHDRIIKKCTNHHDLENMLNQKFRAGDKNHLISILSQPVPAKRGGVFVVMFHLHQSSAIVQPPFLNVIESTRNMIMWYQMHYQHMRKFTSEENIKRASSR